MRIKQSIELNVHTSVIICSACASCAGKIFTMNEYELLVERRPTTQARMQVSGPAHPSMTTSAHKKAVRLGSLSRPSWPRRLGALFTLPPALWPGRLRLRSPTPNTSPERRAEIRSSNSPAPLIFLLSPSILPRSSLPFSCTSAARLASRLLCLSFSIWGKESIAREGVQ